MENSFAAFKKIDAHSHIGAFGSPFNVNFDTAALAAQMAEYNIEKTILCPAGATLNQTISAVNGILAALKTLAQRNGEDGE